MTTDQLAKAVNEFLVPDVKAQMCNNDQVRLTTNNGKWMIIHRCGAVTHSGEHEPRPSVWPGG